MKNFIWKSIDTIPKNGKQFLLWDGKNFAVGNQPLGYEIGHWLYHKKTKQWYGQSITFQAIYYSKLPSKKNILKNLLEII